MLLPIESDYITDQEEVDNFIEFFNKLEGEKIVTIANKVLKDEILIKSELDKCLNEKPIFIPWVCVFSEVEDRRRI